MISSARTPSEGSPFDIFRKNIKNFPYLKDFEGLFNFEKTVFNSLKLKTGVF